MTARKLMASLCAATVCAAFAEMTVNESVTLDGDADWRNRGMVTIASGVTVDLNGHRLFTAGVSGDGTVVSGDPNGYRFYRFKVDATGGTYFQISAIHLYSGDSDITGQRTALHWRQDNFNENYKSGYNPGMALDGNTATKWFDDRSKDDIWVTVEYEAPVFVTRYSWYTGGDTQRYPDRNPTAWRLQASNDNVAWTDLDVVTGATPPAANKTLAYGGLVNSNLCGDGGYRFYRFKVDVLGRKDFQISAIHLYSGDSDITGQRTAFHWRQDNFNENYKSGYNPGMALDGNTATKWFDDRAANDIWVTVEYEAPVFVTRYDWYTAYDTSNHQWRNPTAWRLQASNDNMAWTDLDVVTGATPPTADKTLAYAGHVNSNPGGDCGELHIEVAEGTCQTNSTVTLSGRLKLVKDGAGTLVCAKTGQTYGGGTTVAAGCIKPGFAQDNSLFGAGCSTITVEDGAQFLDDVFCMGVTCDIDWVIAGNGPDGTGAIRAAARSSGRNNALIAWGRSLTLAGDATVGSDEYAFDFVAPGYGTFPIALNGHALTVKSSQPMAMRESPSFLAASLCGTDAGTIVVGDNLCFYPYRGNASDLSHVTFVVSAGAEYHTRADDADARGMTVSNLVYCSASASSQTAQTTTVLGTYTPASATSAPKVQLGDATHLSPTLDLSSCVGTFDVDFGGGLTFAEGATVAVRMGGRRFPKKVIGWAEGTGPSNVTFVLADADGRISVEPDGVYCHRGLGLFIR